MNIDVSYDVTVEHVGLARRTIERGYTGADGSTFDERIVEEFNDHDCLREVVDEVVDLRTRIGDAEKDMDLMVVKVARIPGPADRVDPVFDSARRAYTWPSVPTNGKADSALAKALDNGWGWVLGADRAERAPHAKRSQGIGALPDGTVYVKPLPGDDAAQEPGWSFLGHTRLADLKVS